MARLIDEAGQEMAALVLKRDPGAVSAGWRAKRLQTLNREADGLLNALYADLRRVSGSRTVDFAQVQEGFAARQLESAVGGVAVDIKTKRLTREFWRAVIAEDPIDGAVMGKWWSKQNAAAKFDFRRQIQLGLVNQENTGQMIRRIRGRSIGRGRFAGGVLSFESAATRKAAALVRTAINHVASRAHHAVYAANSDVTEKYEYVATLDSRTTAICASLDGKTYKYSEGPIPPQHYNCRSTIVPVVDWKGLGIEPPAVGERASIGGPVSARTNYSGWLRGQPASVQAEVLGAGKAKLFREGKIGLGDIVRSDNSIVTLKELQEGL
jgi:SPP1 gp7 family putative phage head morphogenesis protein